MNNYSYYGNNPMYVQELQNMRDRIDKQMMQMQQVNQPQNQPVPITQNFQLAPNNNGFNDFDAKYAKDDDEVKNTLTLKNTLFVDKDMNKLWLKDASGSVKRYSLAEIIQKDEKDIEIDNLKLQNEQNNKIILQLQEQINQLKEVTLNDKSNVKHDDEYASKQKSTDVSNDKSSKKQWN